MDFEKYEALSSDTPIPLDMLGPDGKPLIGDDGKPVQFFLLPPDSKHLNRERDAFRTVWREKQGDDEETPEDKDRKAIEFTALSVAGWSKNWTLEKKKPAYSRKKAVEVLSRFPFVYDQVLVWSSSRGKAWAFLSENAQNTVSGEAA